MPDPVKPSRLELRLQSEIAAAPNDIEADCKRAELAAYRARLGRLDEARAELGGLRCKYFGRELAASSAWINFAESDGCALEYDGYCSEGKVSTFSCNKCCSELTSVACT